MWMFGMMFSVVSSVYTLYQLQRMDQHVDTKEGEGVIESKKIARFVTL